MSNKELSDSILTKQQKEEIDRRLELHYSGKGKNYSLQEVMKEAKSKFRK